MTGPLPDDFLRLTQPQSSSAQFNFQDQGQQPEQVFMPLSPVVTTSSLTDDKINFLLGTILYICPSAYTRQNCN